MFAPDDPSEEQVAYWEEQYGMYEDKIAEMLLSALPAEMQAVARLGGSLRELRLALIWAAGERVYVGRDVREYPTAAPISIIRHTGYLAQFPPNGDRPSSPHSTIYIFGPTENKDVKALNAYAKQLGIGNYGPTRIG